MPLIIINDIFVKIQDLKLGRPCQSGDLEGAGEDNVYWIITYHWCTI